MQPEEFRHFRNAGFRKRRLLHSNFITRAPLSILRCRLKRGENSLNSKQAANIAHQLKSFWSGKWNKDLIIHPEALEHLSRFINYRFTSTLEIIKYSNNGFDYNQDTLIAWLFFQWLLLSKNKQNIIGDLSIPDWFSHSLKKQMNIKKHVIALYSNLVHAKYEKQIHVTKAEFSKALGEGLLNACLNKDIQQVIFNRKPTQEQISELFTTTNLLIELGNYLEIWDLCFVNAVVLPFNEKNPFADMNEWQRAIRFEKTVELINQAHEANCKVDSFLHARVLTSLMLDSYILDEKTLHLVLNELNDPSKLQRIANQIVIYITGSTKGEKLIFISPITEVYYRQYLKSRIQSKQPFDLSSRFPDKDFYQTIGKSANTLKLAGFKSWKHSIKAYLQLKGTLNSMGLAYISGEYHSHPLLPKVLKRIFDFKCEANFSDVQGENLSSHVRLPRSYLWSKLRSILNVKHIKKSKEYEIRQGIKYQLRELIADKRFTANEKLIANYALSKIDKSHGREGLSPSTILTHIDAFGLALILSAEGFELLIISAGQRQAMYLKALDINGIKANRYLFYLKLFEDWLTQSHKSLGLDKSYKAIPDYDEIFADVKKPEFFVDASVLTFEEFDKVKRELIQAYLDTEPKKIEYLQATILLVLGFKLDLRRSEAVYIQGKDYVFDETQPNLFIRDHEARKLKTDNAKRDFHLEEHLDTDEITLFLDYFKQIRYSHKGYTPKYLFPEKKTTLIPEKRIVEPLLKTIKKITGDDEFKFHNLRHSKASWDMLSIFNAQFDLGLENTVFNHLPLTSAFLSESKQRWQQATHSAESIHKAPFFLHRQMGHASLMTTMKNYIHTMDFVIAGFQQKNTREDLSIERASNLGIVKKSTLYKEAKKENFVVSEFLLEKVLPWSTFKSDEITKPSEQKKPLKTNNQSHAEYKASLDSGTLTPIKELSKLRCFRLFEAFHFIINSKEETPDINLEQYGLGSSFNKKQITDHFEKHNFARFKMPSTDASLDRLIEVFNHLPKEWQQAIFNESFFQEEAFAKDRALIEQSIDRMSFKLENAKETLALVKEVDILCNSIEEAKPVIELIRKLGWHIKCRFMNPKNGPMTWSAWQESLNLSDSELNNESVVKAKVSNSQGRLTIRLKKTGKSEAKFFEQYLSLIIIYSYFQAGIAEVS